MLEKGSGTILYTGATASLRGGAKFSGLVLFPPFVCILMYQRLVLRTFNVSFLGRGQVCLACSGAVNRKRVWPSGNSCGAHHHRRPGGPGAKHQGTTTLDLEAVPVTTGLSHLETRTGTGRACFGLVPQLRRHRRGVLAFVHPAQDHVYEQRRPFVLIHAS